MNMNVFLFELALILTLCFFRFFLFIQNLNWLFFYFHLIIFKELGKFKQFKT